MALPNMQPQWMRSFRTPMELNKINVERNEQKYAQYEKNHNFFRKNQTNASKTNAWTSQASLKKSLAAIDKIFDGAEKNEKEDKLLERRNRLRKLLEDEGKLFQQELRSKRLHLGNQDLSSMRQRVDNLQSEREEERKLLAEEKLYEHWRKNEPRVRQAQSEKLRKNVINNWNEQVIEKKEDLQTAKEEENKINHYLELENLKALQQEREKERLRKEKQKEFSKDLRDQMLAIQEKEKEAVMFREEEERLLEHQKSLQGIEEKRKRYLEEKKKQELGRILIRQYKLQLKRKSKQVQEALELDLKILKDIAEKEREEQQIKSSRKEQLKADAEYMKKVIDEQLRLEKSREAELDQLYQEEASREWRKRESEWERERLAREKLMKAVLEERQEQIKEKMEVVREQHKESIEERERLLQELEEDQMLTHREHVQVGERKKQREEELLAQITSRETEREKLKRMEENELERKRIQEQRHENEIARETQRINLQDDHLFPSFRRKRVAFT